MMEETSVPTDESYDSFDEQYAERPTERWAPLGAANAPPHPGSEASHESEKEKLMHLEEEQEMLNTSLLALTTHFAQIQFRLKQVVSADSLEKEELLKELEEFAFKGIPDVRGSKNQDAQIMEEMSEKEYDIKITEQREKQQELILQLKSQLEDLETYAWEMGDGNLPSNKLMEKQHVIIDELRQKLDMDLEDFDKLGTEDLRRRVDKAVGQIVNPAKVKEKLVDQLKTQIIDLERFIDFLQGEAQTPGPLGQRCSCPVHPVNKGAGETDCQQHKKKLKDPRTGDGASKSFREQTLTILRQTLTVLQIFAISQFGCGGKEFQRNLLKRTSKGNHWGDLRAQLEVTVDRVVEQVKKEEHFQPEESDYASDSEDAPVIQCNQELTGAVRKELAMALKDLLQHGLMEVGQSTSLVPLGCFPNRSSGPTKMMHAWDLFLKYFEMKHGREYNESPARKLSQSFSLEIVGGRAITAKQTMLTAIEEVLSSHVPLKRSEDSQLKAFVCIALNEKKLVQWLRLILRNSSLVEYYYQPWSYVVKTGFDDALASLDRLTKLNFKLPVDLAVRPFKNIKDAF